MSNIAENNDKAWKKFLRRHWKMTLVFIGGAIGAVVSALFVFLWVVANAQTTGLVPTDLGLWTVGYSVTFILNVILWEFLFIGIPVIASVILILIFWWMKLPEDERKEYTTEQKKGKSRRGTSKGGSGAVSFLILLTWLIVIWVNNLWNVPFENWLFDQWIYFCLTAIFWDLIIFGIPLTILILLWLRHELTEQA
ncbi:MAG: hypothetical protein ACTSRS_12765 [Candidatus Helarchaeota archaeon]